VSGYICHFAVSRSLALCNLALRKINNGQLVLFTTDAASLFPAALQLTSPDTEVGTVLKKQGKGNITREGSLND
jgi:hypothetical protein